jgi:hypothetical protein
MCRANAITEEVARSEEKETQKNQYKKVFQSYDND